ncbi:sensor histidine kinase [Polymorphobacter glacialis]|uniref:Sensor histidine kinase n=1 Tax=Sandarakinorhabdus glacialis TaxID=1614636 RepID=A0A916ZPH4_9SPHN|nr:histidine kinase dimerization/phosphoacceptor domain -containing protein [Polymorphobacter glacialis]GGE07641.1 sensor histidine kinase [Polymorphobacter glacialis]
MRAPVHPREHPRLAALQDYAILDTPREQDFDDIVALAAALCAAPAAQINFIDSVRQWSKAEVGVGVQELPLTVSICAHAILEDDYVEIADLREDVRTRDNPVCTGPPHVRFYAGIQLRSDDGYPVGTLCVLDMQPRVLDTVQRQALRVLASQVVAQLDLRAALSNEIILRREIDHRVKNSLQTVNAYVRLERTASANPETVSALRGIEQQIGTIAALHELLAHSDDAGQIDLGRYLGEITDLLKGVVPKTIGVTGRFEDVDSNAKVASLIGLIINELIANAVKHSFKDTSGSIVIAGELSAEGMYLLTVQDNGVEAIEPKIPNKRDGLGQSIIDATVRQLGGSIVRTMTSAGYRTVVKFDHRTMFE